MTTQIKLLSENLKVIPVYYSREAFQTTDVRPPNIVLTNGYDHIISIDYVEIRCLGGGNELALYRIPWAVLEARTKKTTSILQELNQTEYGRGRIGMLYGDLTITPDDLSLVPLPGCSILLPLRNILPIVYTGFQCVESMEIAVWYATVGVKESVTLLVPMTNYQCRGTYTFPLRHSHHLYQTTNPVANVTGHRNFRAEEFAIDMVVARQDQTGCLVTRYDDPTTSVRDFLIYGNEVRAIGDGVVTKVSNSFPNALLDAIGEGYASHRKQVLTDLSSKIGGRATLDGNYVVIDHENGEFSQYCHLMENSIMVQVGARVSQGQAIGRVGNTGNSAVPHLHLQLMDGPDETTANGLPIRFQDVNAEKINDEVGENSNTLMFSPYLNFTLQAEGEPA